MNPGIEPRRLVAETRAQKLLDRFGVNRPSEIVLEDIAYALGIEITFAPLTGADAHLVRVGNKGGITISERIRERGRQRFAISHEIGHWELHTGRSQVFLCTAEDMRDYQSSPEEIEANIFASELLMPMRMMLPQYRTVEPSLGVPEEISHRFDVSLTAATLRYVSKFNLPLMVVFSSKGRVTWWRRNDEQVGHLYCEPNQALGAESRAAAVTAGAMSDRAPIPVPWEAWFPHVEFGGGRLHEQSKRFENYDFVTSLLYLEPA